ncbi:MAG: hypothetical protein K2I77_04975 [Anaeroplasmataceae bacterium]|nr:hypothetical protein [Anaeroplasmataceae bacterium]
MKRKKCLLVVIILLFLFSLSSCKKQEEERNGATVYYHLNGGLYGSNNTLLTHYYDQVREGDNILIQDPMIVMHKDAQIQRQGYTLEGWYQKMNEDGTFEDKWDFDSNRIGHDGVHLYAYWKPKTVWSFEVYSKEDGTFIKSYNVSSEGAVFDSNQLKRSGYTCIGYEDENGKTGNEIKHPGGETSTAVKIYASYIKGDYRLVRTAEDLISAAGSKTSINNIYLMNDIDMGGREFKFANENYTKHFIGNGFTISNFKVVSDPNDAKDSLDGDGGKFRLYVSLFKGLRNCTIEDVHFENVSFEVSKSGREQAIYFTPLANQAENATVKDVTINGTVNVIIPISDSKPFEIIDRLCYLIKDGCSFENCKTNVTNITEN